MRLEQLLNSIAPRSPRFAAGEQAGRGAAAGAGHAGGASGSAAAGPQSHSIPLSPRSGGHHHHPQQHRHPQRQQQQAARQTPPASPPQKRHAAPPAASPLTPRRAASRADRAATKIQAAWRGWRLSRHRGALRQLAGVRRQLAAARRTFERYRHENARQQGLKPGARAPLTDEQFLECQELATRVLLAVDEVSVGGAAELRAVRKGVTTAALALCDEIQAASPAAAAAAAHGRR